MLCHSVQSLVDCLSRYHFNLECSAPSSVAVFYVPTDYGSADVDVLSKDRNVSFVSVINPTRIQFVEQ